VVQSRALLIIEPLGVIQGKARYCEKKKKCEAEHRQIRMQPAREMRETPFPVQKMLAL
jgi:hypothetical protein